jgi:hypothetical protein
MADQLRPSPPRASPAAIFGRILFPMALVLGALVLAPVVVDVLDALWRHVGIVAVTGAVLVACVLAATFALKRQS